MENIIQYLIQYIEVMIGSDENIELEVDESKSLGSMEIEGDEKDLKTHVDFSLKVEEDHKKITMYVELNPKMITNLIREAQKNIGSGSPLFDDERKVFDKYCIFGQDIELPISHIKGQFFVNFFFYRGLTLNIYLDDDQLTYARTKVHFIEEDKWKTKWLECLQSHTKEKIWITDIKKSEIQKIFQEKVLLDISFERQVKNQIHYVGIQNQGNTCYMNAILQVLFFIIPLRKVIVEGHPPAKSKLFRTLQDLFLSLMTSSTTVSAYLMLKDFSLFDEYPNRQQDIHQFLISLFDKLEIECPEIKHFWVGKDYQIVTSKDKRYSSKQQQQFNELQLHMADISHIKFSSVQQSLSSLLNEETVDEMIETDKFGKLAVMKRRKFESLPPVLFMNVKRYKYNVKRKQLSKICHDLSYPENLNLDFLLDTPGHHLNYVLYAVTVHKGRTPNSGHYFSFINTSKDMDQPEWYQFNDSHVWKVRTEKVYEYTGKKKREIYLNEEYGKWQEKSRNSEETAYLLVYMRKDIFEEYQKSQIEIPQWFLQKEKNKLTQQEEKYKTVARFYGLTSDKEQDYEPFSDDIYLSEIKLMKSESLREQFIKAQQFLTFQVGTVWRVNKKAKSIKYTGKKYSQRYSDTVKKFTENKFGLRRPEYFLILGTEKSKGGNQNLGILHTQQHKGKQIKRNLSIHAKEQVPEIIAQINKSNKNVTFEQQQMDYFMNGWNDYLFILIEQ